MAEAWIYKFCRVDNDTSAHLDRALNLEPQSKTSTQSTQRKPSNSSVPLWNSVLLVFSVVQDLAPLTLNRSIVITKKHFIAPSYLLHACERLPNSAEAIANNRHTKADVITIRVAIAAAAAVSPASSIFSTAREESTVSGV
ncbi:hypothetical protein EV682_1196 [Iodobacter fluviatilis]|uniref:Uncharacterized protein n=1 Tax=Iodobacter fluviatilis TaxID=537 RepID=A0A377Q998_9NEIS|nr:hypothetical protein EV682_1196 [Iodobacter fluviatilis]STQ91856.1 Uncharacterised protein [Iodobacter fluviatilis]